MTPADLKAARHQLGLTLAQLGALLDIGWQQVARMEMSPDRSTSRCPAPRVEKLISAYLAGYRPDNWPK